MPATDMGSVRSSSQTQLQPRRTIMTNSDVARQLQQQARKLAEKYGNLYRIRAYRRAAHTRPRPGAAHHRIAALGAGSLAGHRRSHRRGHHSLHADRRVADLRGTDVGRAGGMMSGTRPRFARRARPPPDTSHGQRHLFSRRPDGRHRRQRRPGRRTGPGTTASGA